MKLAFPEKTYATILDARWINWDFGIPTGLPETVEIKNVKAIWIKWLEGNNGIFTETVDADSGIPIYYCYNKLSDYDVSDPNANMGTSFNPEKNLNPYALTKALYITENSDFSLILNADMFKDMKVYVDGEEYEWKSTGKVEIPK